MRRNIFLLPGLILLLLCLLLPTGKVLANSLPKPTEIWYRVVYQDESPTNIDGIQLIGCTDDQCLSTVLLKEYGQCNGPDCLVSPAMLSNEWKLDCAGNRCLFVYYFRESDRLPQHIEVVLQVAGQTWKSIPMVPPLCCFRIETWKFVLDGDQLVIEQDDDFKYPIFEFGNFIRSFSISTIIELFVAGVLFWAWGFKKISHLIKMLAMVLFANTLSYPTAWFAIPSWGQVQYDYMRDIGVVTIIVAGIFTTIAIRSSTKDQKNYSTLYVIIPAVLLIGFFIAFVSWYANFKIHMNGLLPNQVILIAETFAVIFESALIAILGRKDIHIKQAIALSVLMNAASYLIGLIII